MKKLTMLTKSIFAALALVAMFAPAALASDLIGIYCVEINSATRPFKLATSEIGEGHYLLNGTHTDPSSSNIGAVIGSASIADGAITMTLRASGLNGSAMSVSTYQFDLALNNLSGVFQSMTQGSNGSVTHDVGVAALVDCNTPMVDPNDVCELPLESALLTSGDSYNFNTGGIGSVTSGHFYFHSSSAQGLLLCANNGQPGIRAVSDGADVCLDQIPAPATYTNGCEPVGLYKIYYLPSLDNGGEVVFRVVGISNDNENLSIEYFVK